MTEQDKKVEKQKDNEGSFLPLLFLGLIVGGFMMFFDVLGMVNETEQPKTKTLSVEKSREHLINEQFSPWNGSHIRLTKLIKQSLNDPKSYKHISTKFWEFKDNIIVVTKYSAKNAYGASIQQSLKGKFTIDGDLLDIYE